MTRLPGSLSYPDIGAGYRPVYLRLVIFGFPAFHDHLTERALESIDLLLATRALMAFDVDVHVAFVVDVDFYCRRHDSPFAPYPRLRLRARSRGRRLEGQLHVDLPVGAFLLFAPHE